MELASDGMSEELKTAITESFGINSEPTDSNEFIASLSRMEAIDPAKLIGKELGKTKNTLSLFHCNRYI